MKKKLKDLTNEELVLTCKKYHDCTREVGKVSCPLWKGHCLKGLIGELQHLEKEIDL